MRNLLFAVRTVKLYTYLWGTKERMGFKQTIIRSGTAVDALIRQAQNAESKADFIHINRALHKKNVAKHCIGLNC